MTIKMCGILKKCLLLLLGLILVSGLSISGTSGLQAAAGDLNLNIVGSIVDITLQPGRSYQHHLTISSDSGLELKLDIDGLAQTIEGGSSGIPAPQDTAANSARTYIDIDRTSITLPAGGSQDVMVSITVPINATPGEKYADIFVYSQPPLGKPISIAGNIIIIINVPGYKPVRTGTITDLSVANAYTGKPIDFNTTFNNSGNSRIKDARNIITVKEGPTEKWKNEMPINAPSLLPNYPRLITASFNAGLPAGNYSVKSDVMLADGTLLDTRTINYNVIDPPPIPAVPVLVSPGSNTAPGPVLDTTTPNLQWNPVIGADYYTLEIYREPYSEDNQVYKNNQINGNSLALLEGIIFAGEKYAWQVNATNVSGTGEFSNRFYFQKSGNNPAVSSVPASNVTTTGAKLNGYLNGRGNTSSVNVSFEYGTSTSYGQTTSAQNLTAAGSFSADITGLSANTTYHFRAKAVGLTTVYSEDQTFTTPNNFSVVTNTATNLSTSGATLNGNLAGMGNNSAVDVSFEYGTSTSYGQTTTVLALADARAFAANITGLTANTTYHFRAKATGAATVYGNNMTFKTLAAASPTPTPTPTPSPSPATSTPTTNTPATTTPTPAGTPASTITGSTANYLLDGMDPASLVVFAFTKEASFASAYKEAGLEILLSNIEGEGVVALARYLKETVLNLAFSDPISKGGTGKPSIKFVDVFVEGVSQGTAAVTVYYSEEEIRDFDPNSLFLAYYFNGKWNRCSNINVSQNDLAVSGDIPINRLNGTVVGLGGSLIKQAPAGVLPNNGNNQPTENGIPWALAIMVIVPIIIIGGVILILERNRRKSAANG